MVSAAEEAKRRMRDKQDKSVKAGRQSPVKPGESVLAQTHASHMVSLVMAAGLVLLTGLLSYGARSLAGLYCHNAAFSLAAEARKLPADDPEQARNALGKLMEAQGFASIELVTATGQTLIRIDSRRSLPVPDWAVMLLSDMTLVLVQPVPVRPVLDEADGTITSPQLFLRAVLDLGLISQQIATTQQPQFFITLAWLLGLAVLLSARSLRRVTTPIERLAADLARVDPSNPGKNLLPVATENRQDEIGQVIEATNQLLIRLDDGMKRDRLQTRDISERERLLAEILDNVADGIVYLSPDRRILRANRMAGTLLGRKSAMAMEGVLFSDFLSFPSRPLFNLQLSKLTAQTQAVDETATFDTTGLRQNGSTLTLNLSVTRLDAELGTSFIIVFRDVGETRRAHEQIRQNEARLRLAVRATRCGLWDQDLVADTFWWSPEFVSLLGYDPDTLATSPQAKYDLIHPEDLEWVKLSVERYLKGESDSFNPDYRLRRNDGTWMWIEDRGTVERDETGAPTRFSGTMMDCTERKRFEKQLMYMATHDTLTALPNRTLLQDRLEHALRGNARTGLMVAALLVDIDRFQLINDSLGHEIGDQLIRAVAQRLQQSIRPTDTLAHLAADEFVVICEDLPTAQEAARIAKRLISSLHHPFTVDGNQLNISISVGIGISDAAKDGTGSAQDLLRQADIAMHSAKTGGGGGYRFFVPDMNREAVQRLSTERHLVTALERQQFRLHYQPKMDIFTGTVIGAEALIRWPHRLNGMTPPDQFIPIAEETGLILGIGEWVLRETLSQICTWRERGVALVPIAVNLSGKQLSGGGVDELILRLLREYEIPPALLEVEITESSVMTRMDRVLGPLSRLRDAGVGIALDDFGTGYSSLAWLRQLPITSLKIDRSFVRDTPHKPEANAIAAIILEIGRQLGLTVVAEGIETREQHEFLREHRCHIGQGWLFHKAMPAPAFEKLLRKS